MEAPETNIAERAPQGVLLDFNELSTDQAAKLQLRIEASKGRVIVFIHPFYSSNDSFVTDMGWADPEDLRKMRESLPNLLSAQRENSPPMLIFQDAEKLKDLSDTLKGEFPKDAYVVPTLQHDPQPAIGSWDDLSGKLKALGVSEVIMAGMNLAIRWPDDEDPEVAGCIANAAHELSKKFNITISKFVYPNTKEDYAQFKGPKGPEDHNQDIY